MVDTKNKYLCVFGDYAMVNFFLMCYSLFRPCEVGLWKAKMQNAVPPRQMMETEELHTGINLVDPMLMNSLTLTWYTTVEYKGGKELLKQSHLER